MERAVEDSVNSRLVQLCNKFGYTCQWEESLSSRTREAVSELDSPRNKEPLGRIAEVGANVLFVRVLPFGRTEIR